MVPMEDWQLNLMCVWESYRKLGFQPHQIHFILQINPSEIRGLPSRELLVALYLKTPDKSVAPDFAVSLALLDQMEYPEERVHSKIEEAAEVYNSCSPEEGKEVLERWGSRLGYPEGTSPFLQLAAAISKKGIIMPAIREQIANAKGLN